MLKRTTIEVNDFLTSELDLLGYFCSLFLGAGEVRG